MGDAFDGVAVEKQEAMTRPLLALDPTNAGDRCRNNPRVFPADTIDFERRDIVGCSKNSGRSR